MILLHHIVQIFALPEGTGWRERSLLLEGLERGGICRVFTHRDDTRRDCMARPKGLAKKLLCSLGVPRCTQHEVNRIALGIDRTVQVISLLLDLNVCLIDTVRVVRRVQPRPASFLQFGRIALDPTKDRRVIDGHTAVMHLFFDIAIA